MALPTPYTFYISNQYILIGKMKKGVEITPEIAKRIREKEKVLSKLGGIYGDKYKNVSLLELEKTRSH